MVTVTVSVSRRPRHPEGLRVVARWHPADQRESPRVANYPKTGQADIDQPQLRGSPQIGAVPDAWFRRRHGPGLATSGPGPAPTAARRAAPPSAKIIRWPPVRILSGAQSDDQADGGDHQFGRCLGDGVGERVSRCGGAQVEPAIGAHQRRGRGGGERRPRVASVSQPAGQGEPDRDRDVQAGPGGVPMVGDGQV